jgi:hypothetical protein
MAAVASGNHQPGTIRIVIDPEITIERVAVEADPRLPNRGRRQRRQLLAQEGTNADEVIGRDLSRRIRIDAAAAAVMTDLQCSVR